MTVKKLSTAILSCALLAGLGSVSAGAGLQETPGSVKVRVVDGNKLPIAGLRITVMRNPRQSSGPGSGSGNVAPNSSFGGGERIELQAGGSMSKDTDKDGIAEFTKLKPGRYKVSASSPTAGRGSEPFKIEAGKATAVDLEVKK